MHRKQRLVLKNQEVFYKNLLGSLIPPRNTGFYV